MQSISTTKKSMRRLVAIVLLAIAAECLLTPNAYADECLALESKQDVETNGSAEDFFRDWAENLEPLVHLRTKFPVELGEISEAELGVVRIDLRNFVYGKHLFREISMPRLVRSLVFARRAMVQNNEKTLRQVFQQTRAVPYFGNFLYGLTFSYENSNAMRRMILAEHHDFVGARIIDAERGFVMTGSFEKESVSDSIGNIYQLGSNSQPLKGMTPQKINEHSSHSQLRADAPQYLTTKYEQEASNHVVEFKHASAEVDLQKIPQEVTQVARLMGEENGFHWHLVWPAEYLQPAEYERFKAWWTHLNDYLTLYGIERGLFPGTYSLPANPREDNVPENYVKLRSAGFRRGVYGTGRDGIELRDVAKTVAETNRIYQQMSDSVANKSWNEFQYSLENSLMERAKPTMSTIDKFLEDNGIAERSRQMVLSNFARTCVFVPMIEFSAQSFRNQHSKEAWANAQQEFLRSLLSTAQQIQNEISKPKANFLELEEIADIAVRMDVGTWAKRMEPSRLYSGF